MSNFVPSLRLLASTQIRPRTRTFLESNFVNSFLSLDNPTYNIPGNAGLKDQTMALKWVKENCSLFGGDSTNITIFGESAGGASVHYHLISDLSKNLFHKAIIMSGCTLNNWSVTPKKDFVQRLAIALGWDEQGEFDEAFEFIQNAKPGDIVKAQEWILSPDEQRQQVLIPFGPTIEPYVSEQCMIPKNPIEMCRTAWSNNVVKIMIGGNSDEGLYKYKDAIQNPKIFQFLGNFEFLVPLELNLSRDDVKCREIGIKMKRYYFDDKEPSKETINEYINIMTDKLFWHGIHRTVMSRLKYSADAATYLYRFNFDSETFNHFRIAACGKGVRGSCHADDLSYLFKNQFVDKLVVNSDEFKTINRMVGIWTKFAINGNPNDAEIKPLNWEPVKDIEPPFKCLNISNQLDIIDLPETKRMAFWDSIYEGTDLY